MPNSFGVCASDVMSRNVKTAAARRCGRVSKPKAPVLSLLTSESDIHIQ